MNTSIDHCLHAATEVPECPDVDAWWRRWRSTPAVAPVDQAMRGGFAADRVAWAFASGYQAALRALLPSLPVDAVAAFCVTEEGGNRPRDIRTRFATLADGGVSISGAKRWTTLGPDSSWLLVVGALDHAGGDDTRPRLKVARVSSQASGLQLLAMPPTDFVPEVPHARVQLAGVQVAADALLPGDGYQRYVKPFRTVEDIHVTLAVLAYLVREARQRGWPTAFSERGAALLLVLADLAGQDADAATTHLALAGALGWAQRLYADAGECWARTPDDPAARRWQRDAALFQVAGAAREQRSARAWERLHATCS